MEDILSKVFGDTPGKLEKWYNWTGVAIPATAFLLLCIFIKSFFPSTPSTRKR